MATPQPLKIAIPSEAPGGLTALGTSRFGRCPYFTIVSVEEGEIQEVEIVKNDALNAMGGAGSLSAQLMASLGVHTIIGGNYGPNAANALNQAGIQMFGTHSGTVNDILQAYLLGQLAAVSSANIASHSGMGGGRRR